MKVGDRFQHRGDWQTEPGVWEITEADLSLGRCRAKPIAGDALVHDESWWDQTTVETVFKPQAPA